MALMQRSPFIQKQIELFLPQHLLQHLFLRKRDSLLQRGGLQAADFEEIGADSIVVAG